MSGLNFGKVVELKKKLDTFRPLTKIEAQKMREIERVDEVYTSNALEGNTLTRYETKMILETGITVGEKPIKDYLEAINLNHATKFIEDLVSGKESLTERTIREIHYLVLNNVNENNQNAGRYRAEAVEISGSKHEPPAPFLLPEKMEQLVEWSDENKDSLHPIEYAALLKQKFVSIHPFIDGNGRTGRLLMNFALTSKGYPAIVIKPDVDSKRNYNRALEHTDLTGDSTKFVTIVEEYTEAKLANMVSTLTDREVSLDRNEPSNEEKREFEELAKKYSKKMKIKYKNECMFQI